MVNVPVGRVIVDDTDSAIQYSGPWFADTSGSQDNSGNYGPAYESTLHGTTFNASLSYIFSGTHVVVYGSNYLRNDSGVLDPKWECFVDHISIGATTPFQFPENNWLFCNQDTLVDGSHVLTVNATVLKAQTFWFDYIEYTPSHSVPLDNTTVLVENSDPQVQSAYGSGWKALGGTANSTSQTNSVFTFNFTGVSLSWYGFIPTEFPHTATTGTYSVDGTTPVVFLLNSLPGDPPSIYNQKFFETEQLEQGDHQIIVLFEGNEETTPLVLDYLHVKNGMIEGANPHTSPTSIVQPTQEDQQHHKVDPIVIVLAVVITVLLFIVFSFIFLYARRYRNPGAPIPPDAIPRHCNSPFSWSSRLIRGERRTPAEAVAPFNTRSSQQDEDRQPNASKYSTSSPGHVHHDGHQQNRPNPTTNVKRTDIGEAPPPQYTAE